MKVARLATGRNGVGRIVKTVVDDHAKISSCFNEGDGYEPRTRTSDIAMLPSHII